MSDATITRVGRSSKDVMWRTTWDFVVLESEDGHVGAEEWSDTAAAVQLARPYIDESATVLPRRSIGVLLDDVVRLVDAIATCAGSGRRQWTSWAMGNAGLAGTVPSSPVLEIAAQESDDRETAIEPHESCAGWLTIPAGARAGIALSRQGNRLEQV